MRERAGVFDGLAALGVLKKFRSLLEEGEGEEGEGEEGAVVRAITMEGFKAAAMVAESVDSDGC